MKALAYRGFNRNRLETERVVARRNHCERNGVTIAAALHVFGFKPCAETRIEDFRLALPKIRCQSTLDPEMIQLQFDGRDVLWEISPYVIGSDMESRETPTFALRFDHHIHLLFIP